MDFETALVLGAAIIVAAWLFRRQRSNDEAGQVAPPLAPPPVPVRAPRSTKVRTSVPGVGTQAQPVSAPASLPLVVGKRLNPGDEPVVIDCETTGLGSGHRIVSFAALRLDADLMPVDGLYLVFNPGRPSDPRARQVHGLSDAYLAQQPAFSDHAHEIRDFIGQRTLVAHNLSFDLRMLSYEFSEAQHRGLLPDHPTFCTMLEMRRRYPGQKATLDASLARIGLSRAGERHGAIEDVMLAMNVLRALHGATTFPRIELRGPTNAR